MKILKFNFSQEFLQELSLFTKESLYGNGEIIFSKGDLDDKLYFIFKGSVELYIEKSNLNTK
jgi:CRP-like cAMP-binding protein